MQKKLLKGKKKKVTVEIQELLNRRLGIICALANTSKKTAINEAIQDYVAKKSVGRLGKVLRQMLGPPGK